jgi:hypothetical protein
MTYEHVTAPALFVETNGIRFAYRWLGQVRKLTDSITQRPDPHSSPEF